LHIGEDAPVDGSPLTENVVPSSLVKAKNPARFTHGTSAFVDLSYKYPKLRVIPHSDAALGAKRLSSLWAALGAKRPSAPGVSLL